MFCPQCGAKLKDGAKFCTECGASLKPLLDAISTQETGEPVEENSAPENEGVIDALEPVVEAQEATEEPLVEAAAKAEESSEEDSSAEVPLAEKPQKATLGSFLMQTRRIGNMVVPTFVAIIIAFILSAGVAYAAVKLVTEVILPAIEQAQGAGEENQVAEALTEESTEVATEETIQQASGNPENIFQVAEILSMNPADISTFFEEHGATVNTPSEIQLSAHENRTCWDLNVNALKDALGNNLYLEHSYDEAMKGYENVILLGKNLTAGSMCFGTGWGSQDEELFSVSTLSSGTKPVDIFLSTNYVQKLSDDLAVQLMKVCGLSSDGYRKFEYGTEVCYANTVEIEGAHYFWFIDQRGTEENVFTSIACLSEETSKTMYSFEFPRETLWDSLNVEEKAEWVAKSFVQMINTGNGSIRTNVVTGEEEILNDDNSGYVLGHYEEGVGFVKD